MKRAPHRRNIRPSVAMGVTMEAITKIDTISSTMDKDSTDITDITINIIINREAWACMSDLESSRICFM